MTKRYRVSIGEIEHSGDVEHALEALIGVDGITAVAIEETDTASEEMTVIVTTTFATYAALEDALEDIGICC